MEGNSRVISTFSHLSNARLTNRSYLTNIYDKPRVKLLLARLDTVADREAWFTVNATRDPIPDGKLTFYVTSLKLRPNGPIRQDFAESVLTSSSPHARELVRFSIFRRERYITVRPLRNARPAVRSSVDFLHDSSAQLFARRNINSSRIYFVRDREPAREEREREKERVT